ncbi:MAG: 6-bladed beta-propeller [Candidatus Delongbacteria bacterium]|nr:6-bladed beta-propeller [Candidatus Delongbacteria bacterium]
MKKVATFLLILVAASTLFYGCSNKGANYKEDSLELKLLQTISGKVSSGDSTKAFSEIEDLEIDSDGDIFLLASRKGKILKFDKNGEFITSFGSLGKEPGQFLSLDIVIIDDEVYVKSFPNKNIVKFDKNGKYLETFEYADEGMFKGVIGEILRATSDKNIVGYMNHVKENSKGQLLFRHDLALMNKKFEKLAILRDYEIEFDPYNVRYFESVSKYTIGGGKIFVAENSEDTYKINVFDLDGNKVKEIVKDYTKVEYNQYEMDRIKTLNLLANGKPMSENKSFKKSVNDVFFDKYGRLLVCSSIKRNETNQKDFIVDIYKDGIYLNTTKVEKLIGEDFVRRFDSRIYFLGDKIYEIVNDEAKINIYAY